MRLAILVRRLGPYHKARLDAAGKLGDLCCVEGGGLDNTYAWDKIEHQAAAFRRLTLFPNADSATVPARALRRAVFRALTEIGADIVAIPGWTDPLAFAAVEWAARTRKPATLMSDSHELAGRRTGPAERVKRHIVSLCSTGFVSGSAAAEYLASLGMPRDRIHTGYDVVDNEHFATGADRARAAAPPRDRFICPARFIWEKNHETLLDAYARYLQLAHARPSAGPGNSPWRLCLIGYGPMQTRIETRIAKLKLDDWIDQTGYTDYDAMPAQYASARALVLASVSETWGLAVNEAMAAGLPVLVSNRCGCAPDLVREGVNGFTFDPRAPDRLAELMLNISDPNTDLDAMSAASRARIAHWTPDTFARGLWTAARTAAAAAPPPRALFPPAIRFLGTLTRLALALRRS